MVQTISTIIFDWGGVLIEDPTPGMIAYFAKKLGVAPAQMGRLWSPYMSDFQCGFIAENDVWTKICKQINQEIPSEPSLWGDAFKSVYQEQTAVWDLVHHFKSKGYKTGFLSNTEIPAMDLFKTKNYSCFDMILFSCAEGLRKPDPQIFLRALEKIGSHPAQTVFIDDRLDYLEGAKQVGINAVHFQGVSQLYIDLEQLGVQIP